uniref:Uncharacterized protein n=1 Tax=Chenopodium quinoa TaxID=63459 RepID=A0A803KU93_CHEQI
MTHPPECNISSGYLAEVVTSLFAPTRNQGTENILRWDMEGAQRPDIRSSRKEAAAKLRTAIIPTKASTRFRRRSSSDLSLSPSLFCTSHEIPVFVSSPPPEGEPSASTHDLERTPPARSEKLVIHTSPLFDAFDEGNKESSGASSPSTPRQKYDIMELSQSSPTNIAAVMMIESKTTAEVKDRDEESQPSTGLNHTRDPERDSKILALLDTVLSHGGSAVNIMPKSTMRKLGITDDELSKSRLMVQVLRYIPMSRRKEGQTPFEKCEVHVAPKKVESKISSLDESMTLPVRQVSNQKISNPPYASLENISEAPRARKEGFDPIAYKLMKSSGYDFSNL